MVGLTKRYTVINPYIGALLPNKFSVQLLSCFTVPSPNQYRGIPFPNNFNVDLKLSFAIVPDFTKVSP